MQLWCFNILWLLLCFSLNTNMKHQCSDTPSHQESFMFENWRVPLARIIVQLAADGWSIEEQSKAEPALSPSIFPLYKRAGPHPARRPTFIRPPGTKHEIGFIRKGFISKRAKSRKPEPGWLVRKCIKEDGRPGRLGDKVATHPVGTRARWKRHQGDLSMLEWYEHAPKITPNIRACSPELETNVLDWCLYENFENTLEYQSYCAASRNSLEKTAVDSKQPSILQRKKTKGLTLAVTANAQELSDVYWLILILVAYDEMPLTVVVAVVAIAQGCMWQDPPWKETKGGREMYSQCWGCGNGKKDSAWRVQC